MSQTYNPFEHRPHHREDEHLDQPIDPAQESLADALRVSFWILKVLMIAALIWYAFSGLFNVQQQEVAVRLRFGSIVGNTPQEQVIRPGGPHLALPFPFEQVVRVSTKPMTIDLNKEFWFRIDPNAGPDAELARSGPLNPAVDSAVLAGDANIIHARWSVTYEIRHRSRGQVDSEAVVNCVKNVGSAPAGEAVVRAATEQAIVQVAAITTADNLMKSRFDKSQAITLIQNSLDALQTGLDVTQLTIIRPTMPASVQDAYEEVTKAVTEKARQIDEAHMEHNRILLGTAGGAYEPLWTIIQAYERARAAADQPRAKEILDIVDRILVHQQVLPTDAPDLVKLTNRVEVGGQAAKVIENAIADRSGFVTKITAEAEEFEQLCTQFRRDPRVFMAHRLIRTLESIFTGPTIETHIVPNNILMYFDHNPDPQIRKKDEEARLEKESEQRQQP